MHQVSLDSLNTFCAPEKSEEILFGAGAHKSKILREGFY
jgi:hypothetical protein